MNIVHLTPLLASSLEKSLCMLNAVRCPYVCNAGRGQLSSKWRHNENDVIMKTEAAWRVNGDMWVALLWLNLRLLCSPIKSRLHISVITSETLCFETGLLVLCTLSTSNFFKSHTWILSLVNVPSATVHSRCGVKYLPQSVFLLQ